VALSFEPTKYGLGTKGSYRIAADGPGSRLGHCLGSRDRDHVERWMNAMLAGSRAAPRCKGVAKDGAPCRGHRLHGSIFCFRHCRGAERDRIDMARLERQRRFALSNCASEKARALKQIRNIERRRLNRLWLQNPCIEGSTLELSAPDDRRVREFLLSDYNLDIDAVDTLTGRPLSFRARDRARWAAFFGLSGRCDAEAVRRRIVLLLRDERRYWAQKDACPPS
jgi:hypothetical protein